MFQCKFFKPQKSNFMNRNKNIEENRHPKREAVNQLTVSDLTDLLHGENRKNVMRNGFYTRRSYSLI